VTDLARHALEVAGNPKLLHWLGSQEVVDGTTGTVHAASVVHELRRLVPALAERVLALEEALSWALDVLELSLKRLDTLETEPYSDEHYAIRKAGLTKARATLTDAPRWMTEGSAALAAQPGEEEA
jgi:hypothetical protein